MRLAKYSAGFYVHQPLIGLHGCEEMPIELLNTLVASTKPNQCAVAGIGPGLVEGRFVSGWPRWIAGLRHRGVSGTQYAMLCPTPGIIRTYVL
jgi:hypothetical protein